MAQPIHPPIRCPVCQLENTFNQEVRRIIIQGRNGQPNTEASMALCTNCGYIMIFGRDDVTVDP